MHPGASETQLFLMYIGNMANDLGNPCFLFTEGIELLGSANSRAIQRDLSISLCSGK